MLRTNAVAFRKALPEKEVGRRVADRSSKYYLKWRELTLTCHREAAWCQRQLYFLQKSYLAITKTHSLTKYEVLANKRRLQKAVNMERQISKAFKVSNARATDASSRQKYDVVKGACAKAAMNVAYHRRFHSYHRKQATELEQGAARILEQLAIFKRTKTSLIASQLPFREEYRRLVFEGKTLEAEAMLVAKYNAIASRTLDNLEGRYRRLQGVQPEKTGSMRAITSVYEASKVPCRIIHREVAVKRITRLRAQFLRRAQATTPGK